MSPFLIYLISIFEPIAILSAITVTILGLVIGAMLLHNKCFKESYEKEIIISKNLPRLFFISLFFVVFVPSKETAYQMIVVPAIVNSQAIQKDLPEIYNLAIEKLKNQLK